MKSKNPFLKLACLALASAAAHAADIVSDTFTTPAPGDGVTIEGRTPETSLSGGNWITQFGKPVQSFQTTFTSGFGNPSPGSFGLSGQSVSAVSIASAGTYAKPTVLIISADLLPLNAVGSASAGRGIALGFYSDLSSATDFSQNRFTGLVLDAAGNLNLVHDPNTTGFFTTDPNLTPTPAFLGTPIAYGGTFDPNAIHRLSYTVNTVTGTISDISLQGSSATYSFTTSLFTDAATNLAGVYISSESGETFAGMDNFLVASEPSAGSFADWMSTNYPTIVFPDNQPGADPDNDGIKNLMEYVLKDGDPSVSTTGTLPTSVTNATDFVFTYFRRAATTGITQTFEYGSTLTSWTQVAIPGGPGVIVTDEGGGIEKVEITVSKGTETKLFGRLQVTQP